MNKLSIKKLLPGVVSIMLIAGMAIQSFATNVDMAAFVNKDKYMTKYYELDFRIGDIEANLERLYKLTCTNLVSFGGQTGYGSTGRLIFNVNDLSSEYICRLNPIADLSENKYLRFNYRPALNLFAHTAYTNRFEYIRPASLFRWHPNIEPASNCTVKITISRTMPSTTTWDQDASYSSIECIMGPFKKFPHYTSTGSSTNNGYICEFPDLPLGSNVTFPAGQNYYSYGTETMPTTWTADTTFRFRAGNGTWATAANKTAGYTQYDVDEIKNQMDTDPYNKTSYYKNNMYVNALPTTDFSKYTNIWFRGFYSTGGVTSSVYNSSLTEMSLKYWNDNK